MLKIYVASPYTVGDREENVNRAIEAAEQLINEGFAPFSPLLTHFHHLRYPHTWDTWMMLDIEWLSVCDALLRLPGEGAGADEEVEFARNNEIHVFYTIEQLKEFYYDEA